MRTIFKCSECGRMYLGEPKYLSPSSEHAMCSFCMRKLDDEIEQYAKLCGVTDTETAMDLMRAGYNNGTVTYN